MSKKPTLAELKNRWKQEESGEKKSYGNYGNIYPFWQMKDNDRSIVRILPDANEENINMFFVEKLTHTLPINGQNQNIACPSMHDDECPICNLSRKFYKEGDKESGKHYYRRKTSMVRLLVIDDPLPAGDDGETYEGKVLNSQFSYQLMEKIKISVVNDWDDDDPYPWDLKDGTNFIIGKTKNGDYSKYDLASGFERKSSSIPKKLAKSIELIDLSTLLPECKEFVELEGMLQASISGDDYDYGNKKNDDSSDDSSDSKKDYKEDKKAAKKAKKAAKKAAKEAEKNASKKADTVVESNDGDDEEEDDDYDDILKQIQNRD